MNSWTLKQKNSVPYVSPVRIKFNIDINKTYVLAQNQYC